MSSESGIIQRVQLLNKWSCAILKINKFVSYFNCKMAFLCERCMYLFGAALFAIG